MGWSSIAAALNRTHKSWSRAYGTAFQRFREYMASVFIRVKVYAEAWNAGPVPLGDSEMCTLI